MKRLCIYFFYDKDGIVDDYVVYFLKKIRNFCDELCIVSNSHIEKDGQKKLEKICSKILLRENLQFYKNCLLTLTDI